MTRDFGVGADWRCIVKKKFLETPAGDLAYREAKSQAQSAADLDGFDRGLEVNELFKSINMFMLPRRENRYGHELRCEVVSCSDIQKTQPGHGFRS
jgi:hypothetical protein